MYDRYNVGPTAAHRQYLNRLEYVFFSPFLDGDGIFSKNQKVARDAPQRIVRHPRSQRPGLQPGEVRVHHLGDGFPGSPHPHHWRRFPPWQRPGNLGNY